MRAPGRPAELADEGVGQIERPVETTECKTDRVGALDNDLRRIHKGGDHLRRLRPADLVGAAQYPVDLDESDDADEALVLLGQSLDQVSRPRRLLRIVLRDVANQDIRIEADHRPRPSTAAWAIASSISSRLTGVSGATI